MEVSANFEYLKQEFFHVAEYDPQKVILERLAELEDEIAKGREELEGMLG